MAIPFLLGLDVDNYRLGQTQVLFFHPSFRAVAQRAGTLIRRMLILDLDLSRNNVNLVLALLLLKSVKTHEVSFVSALLLALSRNS